MTIDGELRAVRAVARQMRTTPAPPDPALHRRLLSWARSLDDAVRGVERGVRFLRETATSPLSESETAEDPSSSPDTPTAPADAAERRRAVAARRNAQLPREGTAKRRVLDAVAAVARDPAVAGLTDVQLQGVTGLSPNTLRPRRGELVSGGWLVDSGTTRVHHGTGHAVWVLSDRAAAALADSSSGG